MGYSKPLRDALGEPDGVLTGVSSYQAAIRVSTRGRNLSPATINKLKNGQVGEEESLRTLAEAYAPEVLTRFGDAVEAAAGDRSEAAAVEWLVSLGNPRWANLPGQVLVGNGPAPPLLYADAERLADLVASRVAERTGAYTLRGGEITLKDLTNGAEVLAAGLRDLEARYGEKDLRVRLHRGIEHLDADEARSVLAELERRLAEYQREKQGEGGTP